MIRRLIILLLIVGCDNSTEPETCENTPECGDCTEFVLLWGECYNIEETARLDLSFNELDGNIPPEIGNLTNLTFLKLSGNELAGEIPNEIGNLVNLDTLNLKGNHISALPENIGNLSSLKYLWLSGNELISFPESIGNLDSLDVLGCNGNLLNNLPESLCNILPNLRTFQVRLNYLCGELPSCLTAEDIGEQDCP